MRITDLLLPIISGLTGVFIYRASRDILTERRQQNYLRRVAGPEISDPASLHISKLEVQKNAGIVTKKGLDLLGLRVLLGLIGGLVGLIMTGSIILGLAVSILCVLSARTVNTRRQELDRRSKQAEIAKLLPDFADMIAVAVEAGLGLDRAIHLYCEKFSNDIKELFAAALEEMDLGKERRRVFMKMVEKTPHEDFQWFIAAILQSEKLGTPMVEALRNQAKTARQRQQDRVKELSATAPIKMLFPIAGLILPSLLIVIIGPAFLHFLN